MPDTRLNNIPERKATIALLALLCLAGLWLRLRNLGALGLVLDEGVQALAVRGILEHGVPITDSGLVYARSLSFLYLQALAAWLFELNPFWLRLPAVLFGVGCIAVTYLLAEALFDRRTALLAAAIIAFSQWEIELSRYARFYTAFQMMYLLSLWCFYRGFIKHERPYQIGFLPAAALTITTHFLSRVLVLVFAVPLLARRYSIFRKLLFGAGAAGLYYGWSFYGKITEWFINQGERLPFLPPPEHVMANTGGLIGLIRTYLYFPMPALPELSFFEHTLRTQPLVPIALLLSGGLAAFYLLYRSFRRELSFGRLLLALGMIVAAVIYQFMIVVILFLLYLMWYVEDISDLRKPALLIVYGIGAVSLGAWLTLMLADPALSGEQILMALGGYPNLMRYFLHRFVSGWPLMSLGFAAGSLWLLRQLIKNPRASAPWFTLGALLLPLVITSCFEVYAETRYFFHLYPLIVIVFALMMNKAIDKIMSFRPFISGRARKLVLPALAVAALCFSQDANPLYAWEIGERTYTSRKDPIRSITNLKPYAFFHQDQETPSLYLREHLRPGDRVAVFGSVFKLRVYQFYLGNVDYLVTPSRNQLRLSDGKLVTPVTGSEVLSSLEQFKQVAADSSRGLWVLGDRLILCEDQCHGFVGCGDAIFGPCWDVYPPEIRAYLRDLASRADYVGEDGETFVIKIY